MRRFRSKLLTRCAGVPLFEAVEGRVLFAGMAGTTTVLTQTPVTGPGQAMTFTARVTGEAGSPAPTGTVAFFEIVDVPGYSSNTTVTFPDPVDPGVTDRGEFLGTAPVGPDGTATLSVASFPSSSAIFTGRFRAAFLGADPVVTLTPRAGGIDRPIVFAEPGQTFGAETIVPTATAPLPWSTKYYLLFPQGHPLAVHDGQITVLSNLPAGVIASDPSGAVSLSDDLGWQTYYVAASTTPLLVYTNASARQLYTGGSGSGVVHFSYATTFTPAPVFAHVADANEDFGSSVSASGTVSADQPTALRVTLSGAMTYTNPPAVTVSVVRPGGGSYSRREANPAPRGQIQSAHAGVDVLVSTGGGGSYSGMSSSGTLDIVRQTFGPFMPTGPFPTGTVSFFDEGDTLLGTVPVDADGNATFYPAPRSLTMGAAHTIHAVYSGDAYFDAADGSTPEFTVTLGSTRTWFDHLPARIKAGDTLPTRAVVESRAMDTVGLTGTFTFAFDGEVFATLPALPGPWSTSMDTAPKLPLMLGAGTHTLTVKYSGDTDFVGSSASTDVMVDAPAPTPPTPPTPTPAPPVWTPIGYLSDAVPTRIERPLPSAAVVPGAVFPVDVTVHYGIGAAPDPQRAVSLALSLDDVAGNSDDIPLAATMDTQIVPTTVVRIGESTYRCTVMLPTDLPLGRYRLVAMADPDNTVVEINEWNNRLVADWELLVRGPALAAVVPDLNGALVAARPTVAVNAATGLSLTLTNPSKTTAVRRTYAVTYYLSSDATYSGEDVKIARQTLNLNLPAGQKRAYPLTYKLPKGAAVGTRYLIAVADTASRSETTHLEVASKAVTVAGPRLTGAVAKTQPAGGTRTKITLRVANVGTGAQAGPVTFRVLSSAGGQVVQVSRAVVLGAGKAMTFVLTVPGSFADASALSVTLL